MSRDHEKNHLSTKSSDAVAAGEARGFLVITGGNGEPRAPPVSFIHRSPLFMTHATSLEERFNERTVLSLSLFCNSTSSYKLSAFLPIVNVRAGNLEI